ncbi:hypothetical protein ABIF62_001329 [Bradyrhizobium japonicum]
MEFVWSVVTFIGHAVEAIFGYVEHHHWIFAFLAGGYVFYLHDRSVHGAVRCARQAHRRNPQAACHRILIG